MELHKYFNNQELEQVIQQWQKDFPRLISVAKIGESYEKRPIWILTITDHNSGIDTNKPAIWIDANIHATEITGTTVALNIASELIQGFGTNERITNMLGGCVYYIVPRVNPDGAELALSDPPRYIRSGVRYHPWAEREEGIHEQDIDGDGRILQMRILDPHGEWKASSLDPRLMEKREPHEHGGNYYRLLPEGLIDEYDGHIIKIARNPEGLDFNRNFPYQWRPEDEQKGAGPYPTSEPEIKALADFVATHPNINIAITYHTFSRVILRPFSTKPDDEMETEDLWVYKRIGEIGAKLTGYRCVSTFHDFKYHPKEITTGGFDDWLYDHFGIFCYTIELWDLPTEAGIKDRKFIEWFREHPHEEDKLILDWVDQQTSNRGYIEWHEFDHPQLGKVELGGWDSMYTWINPPASLLQNEVARNIPFALTLGDMLPRLQIKELSVRYLEGQDYSIKLVIENSGFLPTFTSAQGKKRKAIRPVRATLDLPENVTLISGKRRAGLGHLEGRSNKLDVTTIWGESPTDHRARAEWVVRGSPDSVIVLKLECERAGLIQRDIQLKEQAN